MTITFQVPNGLLDDLADRPEELGKEILREAAIQLYSRGLVSQGRGAEIAGLNRREFIEALGRAQVPACQVTAEELEEEVERADQAHRQRVAAFPDGGGRGSVRAGMSDGSHGGSPSRGISDLSALPSSPPLNVRKKPAHGVQIDPSHPTIVFVTVCTKGRRPWLASPENHAALREVWRDATAWVVGRYVLMPDHLHLFAAPGRSELPLENWIRYWKSRFTLTRLAPTQEWQADHWDTRLRSDENYDSKWFYVRENPVRAGLVDDADSWPYQGELKVLPWS